MTYRQFLLLIIQATKDRIIRWREYNFRNTGRISELGCKLCGYSAIFEPYEIVINAKRKTVGGKTRVAFKVVVYDMLSKTKDNYEKNHRLCSDSDFFLGEEEPEDCTHLILVLYLVVRCMARLRVVNGFYNEYTNFGVSSWGLRQYVPHGWSPDIFFYKKRAGQLAGPV